jgi:hypothetical protein
MTPVAGAGTIRQHALAQPHTADAQNSAAQQENANIRPGRCNIYIRVFVQCIDTLEGHEAHFISLDTRSIGRNHDLFAISCHSLPTVPLFYMYEYDGGEIHRSFAQRASSRRHRHLQQIRRDQGRVQSNCLRPSRENQQRRQFRRFRERYSPYPTISSGSSSPAAPLCCPAPASLSTASPRCVPPGQQPDYNFEAGKRIFGRTEKSRLRGKGCCTSSDH